MDPMSASEERNKRLLAAAGGGVEYVSDADIRSVVEENQRLREALLWRGISKAPCDICGYAGPGYHQPETHVCIADADRLRAALAGEASK